MKASQVTSGSSTNKAKNGASSKPTTSGKSRKAQRYQKAYHFKSKLAHLVRVDIPNRTIHGPFRSIEEVPTPERYYFRQLIKMGFNSQLSLF